MRKPSIYRGLTVEQRDELDSYIVSAYREGLTMDDIADEIGTSKSKVWSVLRAHNTPSRKAVWVDGESGVYHQKQDVGSVEP